MLQKTFRIYLFIFLVILLGCDRGGNILMVGSMKGPAEIYEGTTSEYSVDAHSDTGITYSWIANPVGFGNFSNLNSASTMYTAPEVDIDRAIVIRVVVNSDRDGPVIRSLDVTVKDVGPGAPINHPPTALAFADMPGGRPGVEVHFYDVSTDPDGDDDIVKWEWDFSYSPDDGFLAESEVQEPTHIYPLEGNYLIQLRVTDTGGLSDLLGTPLEIIVRESQSFNLQQTALAHLEFNANDVEVSGHSGFALSPEFGLDVFNISDPQSPILAYRLFLENNPKWIAIDGNYLCALSDDSLLQIINIEDPVSPYIVNSFYTGVTAHAIATQDGYAYIALGMEGLAVVDIDPPESANVVSILDLSTEATEVDVDGIYAVISSNNEAVLHIVGIWAPEIPTLLSTIDTNLTIKTVEVSGGYAFTAANAFGLLQIYDIDPPEEAHVVQTTMDYGVQVFDLEVVDNIIYVSSYNLYTIIVDFDTFELSYGPVNWLQANLYSISVGEDRIMAIGRNVAHVSQLNEDGSFGPGNTFLSMGEPLDVTVIDNHIFIAAGALAVYDISNPDDPQIKATMNSMRNKRVAVDGNYAYTLGIETIMHGFSIYDVSSLDTPSLINRNGLIPTTGLGDLTIDGGYAYITSSMKANLEIWDVNVPDAMNRINSVDIPGWANDVETLNGYAYVAVWDDV
ncbi:PKD domain-containing protein, partial [bacterium]|nr:PKD domain-containing protein [bacterium]